MVRGEATVKRYIDALTSGGCTSRPRLAHSSMMVTTLSVLSMSDDSTAAMKAAGWCAFSHAVWYDSIA